jgi:hypothetical protein
MGCPVAVFCCTASVRSSVLLAGRRRKLHTLPDIRRAAVRYYTPTTARVLGPRKGQPVPHTRVWCLPTEQNWHEVA